MRQIKFRIWEPRHKVMLYPKVIQFFEGMVDKVYGDKYKFTSDSEPDMIAMQFTGICDKNETEIYEGDILQFPNLKPLEVKWQGDDEKDYNYGWNFGRTDGEVIGNIYENDVKDF